MHAPCLPRLAALALLLAPSSGCASTGEEKSMAAEAADAARAEADQDKSTDPEHPIGDLVEATRVPEPIGKVLADLDQQIRAWNNLFLAAQNETDRTKARTLEKAIMTTAHRRRQEIVEQLETGPLNNRIVAGAALGFTKEPTAQSPLLAALDDAHSEVVSSALFGLWLLGQPDTPLDRIASKLMTGESEDVRTNAALCLSSFIQAGARSPAVTPALRMGLLDSSATVRAHCSLALAELEDLESFQAIADLMMDKTALTATAAARAVAHMGIKEGRLRGKAARALVTAWLRSDEPAKSSIYRSMVELSGINYGSDEEEWSRWATRLP